jgi:nucleotide-binding universal stress UspA family protein
MRPILVAFDQSPQADDTLRWAGELARITAAPLEVLTVFEPTYSELSPQWFDERTRERRERVRALLEDIGQPDAPAAIVESERPFDALATYAAHHDVDTVVIGATGTHSPGGLGGGHPAQSLLHATHLPIAIVRPDADPLAGGVVVVGVDGSGANVAAVRRAEHLAAAGKCELHAVFAYDPIDDTFSHPKDWHRHSDEVRAELAEITEVEPKLYMAAGHPSKVLIEHAVRERAGLIVVGTRGRGGFDGLITGRVPSQLIAHAPCPLLVVAR